MEKTLLLCFFSVCFLAASAQNGIGNVQRPDIVPPIRIPRPPVPEPSPPPVSPPTNPPTSAVPILNIPDGALEGKPMPAPQPPGPCVSCSATFIVQGNDAIYLAGRTDIVIPPANAAPASYFLARHAPGALVNPPDPLIERRPQSIRVSEGDVIRIKAWIDRSRPNTAGINFYPGNSNNGPYGPGGMPQFRSNLRAYGGLSAFVADVGGPLVGVFLDDRNPASLPSPSTERFLYPYNQWSTSQPQLRQIFYIGNGACHKNIIAPRNATRLFIGIADGGDFRGVPMFYDDNNGGYYVNVARWQRVGTNRYQLVNPYSELSCLAQCNGQCGSSYRITPRHAIFLADRDDLTIPNLGVSPLAPFPLRRHNYVNGDFGKELFPLRIPVGSLNLVRIRSAGSPGNNYFNGIGNTAAAVNSNAGFFETAGSPGISNIPAVGGISGFKSDRRGPLVGVFTRGPEVEYPKYLTPPPTINFTAPYNQLQTMFPTIRQVFYIGSGQTSNGQCRPIYVPTGAKYLHLGYADSFNHQGLAGAYEDNDGLATLMINRFRRYAVAGRVYLREVSAWGGPCKLAEAVEPIKPDLINADKINGAWRV